MKAKTTSNPLLNRVDARLLACATAAGASLAVTPAAQATIISSGPLSISIPATTAGVYLNAVTGVNNVSPALVPGWDVNPFSSAGLSWFNPATPAGGVYVTGGGSSVTLPDNLAAGTLISAASVFGSGSSETTGATAFVLNSANNYVGFRFQDEANGNQIEYGWLQISLGATLNDPARAIVGYAYENSGAGIQAGATGGGGAGVPDSGATLPLLGLAFAGTVAARRMSRRGEART